jgi:hypothetical protein
MTLRSLAAATLAAAMLVGCSSAPRRWSTTRASPSDPERERAATRVSTSDPERWERAACRIGEYPVELDARALARARHQDLRARQSGATTAPVAAARLESQRTAFDARCAAWRAAAGGTMAQTTRL